MAKNRRTNLILIFLKFLNDYKVLIGFFVVSVGGSLIAFASLPERVKKVEARTDTIETYIVQQRQIEEKIDEAPPGWIWDKGLKKYVEDLDYIPPEPQPKKGKRQK